jgi:hypothetical protein
MLHAFTSGERHWPVLGDRRGSVEQSAGDQDCAGFVFGISDGNFD